MNNIFHTAITDIDPDDTEPGCGFMLEMLNGLADGTATGITKWYAERHVEGCPHCAAALSGLNRLRARLKANATMGAFVGDTAPVSRALRQLNPDRIAALEAGFNEIDKKDVSA